MNATLLLLKYMIPALEAFRHDLEEDEAERACGSTGLPESRKDLHTPSPKSPRMKVLNLSEASGMLGMSKAYLYKLTSQRCIPFYKLGSRLLFDEYKLQAWIEGHAVRISAR